MTRRILAVRLDGAGDVLLAGPAVRALAAAPHAEVTMLCGPAGAPAAHLLPGVRRVLVWASPWVVKPPPPVSGTDIAEIVATIARHRFDEAVILTSFHQSPLPTAVVLRLAGVARITGASADYPGTLLDTRLRPGEDLPEDIPEPQRALAIAGAAGFRLPCGDTGELVVRRPPRVDHLLGDRAGERYVVVHPGGTAPARRWPAASHRALVHLLTDAGWGVVVTGGPDERSLTRYVADDRAVDVGGRTSLRQLAGVIASASAIVVGNTVAAHLAAAVGTPVVSLFAPVVPAVRWRPYRVRHELLGDQTAPCRNTRALNCPVPGHPCLSHVTPADVAAAVHRLTVAGPNGRARSPDRMSSSI